MRGCLGRIMLLFLCVNLFADSVRCCSAGSGGKLAPCHILIKEAFCSLVHMCFFFFLYSARRPVICYTCVDLSPASLPTSSLLRSIVFVLYANVYQRVPTVSASTYKVMYWHGRVLGERAELAAYRGCAADGRLGRWGNAAVAAWEEEAALITRKLPLSRCYVSEGAESKKCCQCRVKTWNFPDPRWMLVNLLWKSHFTSLRWGGERAVSGNFQSSKQKKQHLSGLFNNPPDLWSLVCAHKANYSHEFQYHIDLLSSRV